MLIKKLILITLGALLLINVGFMYAVANPTIAFHLLVVLALALILYGIFYNKLSRKIHIIIGSACAIPLAFVLFLFIYGNVSNVTYAEDVVIILGAGVRGEAVSRPLASRLDTAIEYWNQNPAAYIVVTGGLGNLATITEAEAMSRYLIRRGIPENQIILEENSTSTYENLIFAREILLNEHFPNGFNAVLVTNDFHIYRAVRTARRAGIEVNRIGAYTDWYAWPVNYMREMLAVLNFKLR